MAGTHNRPEQAAELRRQAEKIAREKDAQSPEDLEALSPEATRQTLHELRVHQIELEMQNEELRRAQTELDAARTRYFDLYDLAPVGYCTLSDPGLMILEANLTAGTLLGVARGALVEQPISPFIFPEDQDLYYRHRKQLFETGEPQACELRMLKNDGTAFWARLEANAAQDEDGEPVCRLMMSDVTERKRAEEALREHARLSQVVLDCMPCVALLLHSKSRKIVAMNAAAAKAGAALGKTCFGSWPRFGEPCSFCLAPEGWATGKERHLEVEAVGVVWEAHWVPVSEDLYMHYAFDITERKQAEEETRLRVVELETVSRLSVALRAVSEQEVMLATVLEETLTALNTAHGAISLLDDSTGRLHTTVARGWLSQLDETPTHAGEGILGHVLAGGDTYIARDLASDPLPTPGTRAQLPSGWGGAFVPIRLGEHVLGVLLVAVPSERALRADELRLLNTLAEMTGNALHRMRLHEETERRLGNLQALGEVERTISSSFDLRLILDTVISSTIAQRGVDAADVLLLHPTLQTLEYAAGYGFRTRAIERTTLRLGEGHAGRAALERRTVHVPNLAETGSEFVRAALLAGEDFVEHHAVPLISKGEVRGVLEMFHRSPLPAKSEWLDFLETLAGQAAIAIENAQLFEGMQRSNFDLALAYDATIEGWSHALDLRDKETEGHTQRVTEITMRLAKAMGIADAELVHVRRGALLHDIGKMGVPDGILLKPGPLSEEEWVLMRRHPQLAYDLLAPITYLRPALDIPLCHHERWDGTGYPRGLAGEEIPLTARLFAVVDVWDALRSDRPYRAAWTEERALAHIRSSAGTHFDPKMVEMFLDTMNEA